MSSSKRGKSKPFGLFRRRKDGPSEPALIGLQAENISNPSQQSGPSTEVVRPLPPVRLDPLPQPPGLKSDALQTALDQLHSETELLEAILQGIQRPSSAHFLGLKERLDALPPDHSRSDHLFDDVVAQSIDQQDEAKHKIAGKFGSAMRATYPIARLVLGIAGTAGTAASFTPVQVTANALDQILTLCMKKSQQDEAVLGALNDLERPKSYVDQLRAVSGTEAILVAATEVLRSCTHLLRLCLVYLSKSYLARFAIAVVESSDVLAGRNHLERSYNNLKDALSLEVAKSTLKRDVLERRAEILGSLSKLDFRSKHHEVRSRRIDGSIDWLTRDNETYLAWRDIVPAASKGEAESPNVETLWCPGLPGAGKTVLASAIIDDLREYCADSQDVLTYLYCDYTRQSSEQNVDKFIRDIARQLAEAQESVLHAADVAIKDKTDDMLAEVISFDEVNVFITRTAFPAFRKVFIVIDALDEFSSEHTDRLALVRALLMLKSKTKKSNLKLCITSRKADDVFTRLQPAELIHVEADIQAIAEHVKAKLDKAGWERDDLSSWLQRDSSLQDKIIDSIVEQSDRIFKLAELQTAHVVNQLSLAALRRSLEELTDDMDAYYALAVGRIRKKTQSDHVDAIIKLLTWLHFAERRFEVGELELALGDLEHASSLTELLDTLPNLGRLVSMSEGLITTDRSEYFNGSQVSSRFQVSLAHETVWSFLENNPDAMHTEGENLLGVSCLRVINIGDLGKDDDEDDNSTHNADSTTVTLVKDEPVDSVEEHIDRKHGWWALQYYSVQHVGRHLHHPMTPKTEELVRCFCRATKVERYVYFQYGTAADRFRSFLQFSIYRGWSDVTWLAIEEGHDLDDRPAIESAIRRDDVKVLQLLLDAQVYKDDNQLQNSEPITLSQIEKDQRLSRKHQHSRRWDRDSAVYQAMHIAADQGRVECLKLLLSYCDILLLGEDSPSDDSSTRDTSVFSPCREAIRSEHVEAAKLMLERQLGEVGCLSATYMADAAYFGNLAMAKDLIAIGVPLIDPKRTNCPALAGAIRYGQCDFAKWVLENGGAKAIHYRDDTGMNALFHAIDGIERTYVKKTESNKYPIVQLLLESGAEVNDECRLNESLGDAVSPLEYALMQWPDEEDLAALLLNSGADGNNRDGRPLDILLSQSSVSLETVRVLLESGADPNAIPPSSNHPLLQAVTQHTPEIVEALLQSGADVNACDVLGESALFRSLRVSRRWVPPGVIDANVARILIEAGASVNVARGAYQARPDDHVLLQSRKLRLAYGSGVDFLAMDGLWANVQRHILDGTEWRTLNSDCKDMPLHWAASAGLIDVVSKLLEHGAVVDVRDGDDDTPLNWAALAGNPKTVKSLLEKGASVDAPNKWGMTALYHCIGGHLARALVRTSNELVYHSRSETKAWVSQRVREYKNHRLLQEEHAAWREENPGVFEESIDHSAVLSILLKHSGDPQHSCLGFGNAVQMARHLWHGIPDGGRNDLLAVLHGFDLKCTGSCTMCKDVLNSESKKAAVIQS